MKTPSVVIDKNLGPINFTTRLKNNPTFLGSVVSALAKLPYIKEDTNGAVPLSFAIEEKITHNNLSSYVYLVEDYKIYHAHLEEVYKIVEETLPTARYKINKIINNEYRKIKGSLLKDEPVGNHIEIIREHSDWIISEVLDILWNMLNNSSNLDDTLYGEDLKIAISIVIGDAFVNCKVLENPNK